MAGIADLKPYQLQYLIAVAEQGSVRHAAQTLGISPAAVSKGLKELEDVVGMTLLVRQVRGVVLTEAGRTLLSHARTITAEMNAALREMGCLQARTITRLSVGITPWIAQTLLPATVLRFSAMRPDVQLSMQETLGTTYASLRDGELDMAIGLAPSAALAAEFQIRPLFSYGQAVICRTGHPCADARKLEDLAGYGWTLSHNMEQYDSPFREFFATHYLAPADGVPSAVLHFTRSAIVGLHLVESSDLLSIAPWPFVEAMRTRYKITAVPLREVVLDRQTSFITRRNTPSNGAVGLFLDALLATVRDAAANRDDLWMKLSRSVDLIHRET